MLAVEMGYDIIFVDDTVTPIPSNLPEAQVRRHIASRRMLYTSAEIDLTETLVQRMNQEYTP